MTTKTRSVHTAQLRAELLRAMAAGDAQAIYRAHPRDDEVSDDEAAAAWEPHATLYDSPASPLGGEAAYAAEDRAVYVAALAREVQRLVGLSHIPQEGTSSGRRAGTYCDLYIDLGTGDHDDVRRLATAAITAGRTATWCPACVARYARLVTARQARRS